MLQQLQERPLSKSPFSRSKCLCSCFKLVHCDCILCAPNCTNVVLIDCVLPVCSKLLRDFVPAVAMGNFGFIMEGEMNTVTAAMHFPTATPAEIELATKTATDKRMIAVKQMRRTCVIGTDLAITQPCPKRVEGEGKRSYLSRIEDWKRVYGKPTVVCERVFSHPVLASAPNCLTVVACAPRLPESMHSTRGTLRRRNAARLVKIMKKHRTPS